MRNGIERNISAHAPRGVSPLVEPLAAMARERRYRRRAARAAANHARAGRRALSLLRDEPDVPDRTLPKLSLLPRADPVVRVAAAAASRGRVRRHRMDLPGARGGRAVPSRIEA